MMVDGHVVHAVVNKRTIIKKKTHVFGKKNFSCFYNFFGKRVSTIFWYTFLF